MMTRSRKLLVVGGMALAALGMIFGLYYAVFVEHQTLDQMGGSLARAFASAAARDASQSQAALEAYAGTKYDYVRQVDAHSHWIGLGMLLILLGVVFGRVNFSEAMRQAIAICLLAGSALFPLAVILQTYHHGALIFKALAVVGPGLVIFGLTATAWGFTRHGTLV
jgi:predicted histidine transporter YuiF (NhaC family)